VDRLALGKAAQPELLGVGDIGVADQNQVGDYLSRSRRVHHAVSAEPVREKEAGDLRDGTKYCVVVRRHLVESGPAALRIDSQILEARNAVRRSC